MARIFDFFTGKEIKEEKEKINKESIEYWKESYFFLLEHLMKSGFDVEALKVLSNSILNR